MGKILGFTILLAAVLIFLNKDKLLNWKNQIIETVNPAVKEGRLIQELKNNINELDSVISAKNKDNQTSEISKKIITGLNSAKKTLDDLQDTNQKLDLGAGLSNLIEKVLPLSGTPSPTWLPPAGNVNNCVR